MNKSKRSKKFTIIPPAATLLVISLIFAFSESVGQKPQSPGVDIELVAPTTLTLQERNLIRVGVVNNSQYPLHIALESIETALHVTGAVLNQSFQLQSGENKYFPLYLRVPRGSADSVFDLRVEIIVDRGDTAWAQSVTKSLPVEKISRILCQIFEDNLLLSDEKENAAIHLQITNRGNSEEELSIELASAHDVSYRSTTEVTLAPGSDTVVSWRNQAVEMPPTLDELQYDLTVRDRKNKLKVYYYKQIRIQPTRHTRRYPHPSGKANTVGLLYQQFDNVQYYSLTGNGNMPMPRGDYSLLYQFFLRKYPSSDGLIADQLRFEAGNGKNTFRLGDIYYGEETGLYNRGAGAEIKVGENVYVNGSFSHSDLLPATLYRFRDEAIASAGVRIQGEDNQTSIRYIHQNDQLLDTRVNLLSSRHRRTFGNTTLESGLGVSSETYERETVFDFGVFANLDLHTKHWNLASDNRYSGSSYPFLHRGNTHSRQMATYDPGGRFRYHANLLWQRYTPAYRAVQRFASSNYRNSRGSLGISLTANRFIYRLESGIGNNRLYAPYLNAAATYRNREIFATGSIQYMDRTFRAQLRQEISRIIPLGGDQSAYFAGQTEVDLAAFDTYFSFFLNKNAFTFFDQANYVLNGYSRDYLLARIHRSFPLARNLSVKVSADHYNDFVFDYQANTVQIAPQFNYRSFEISYEAGYRAINGSNFFLHSLSIYKTFGNPLEARYDLQVKAFLDRNQNGRHDPAEPPVPDVMMDIGQVRLVTNAEGKAVLKKLPRDTYEVRLLDRASYASSRNVQQVFLGSSQTLMIPLHEGYQLKGRVELADTSAGVPKGDVRVIVRDPETNQQWHVPCNQSGDFQVALPKGRNYVLSVDASTLPESFQASPAQRTVEEGDGNTQIFTIGQKRRNIIRKQFGRRGPSAEN